MSVVIDVDIEIREAGSASAVLFDVVFDVLCGVQAAKFKHRALGLSPLMSFAQRVSMPVSTASS
jgi:hypothetical protein